MFSGQFRLPQGDQLLPQWYRFAKGGTGRGLAVSLLPHTYVFVMVWLDYYPLVDLGGVHGARPSLWDPILSFSHKCLVKSAHIGGPCPPNGSTCPLWDLILSFSHEFLVKSACVRGTCPP